MRTGAEILDAWLVSLTDAGAAAWTVEKYRMAGRRLLAWAEGHGGWAVLQEEGAIRAYLRQWKAPATRGWHLAVARQLAAYMVGAGLIRRNGPAGVRYPKVTERAPRILTDAEDQALQAVVATSSVEVQAFMALVRYSGRRVGEVVGHRPGEGGLPGLRRGDVDLARQVALVVGKGGRMVPVYLHGETVRLLRAHLEHGWSRDRRPEAPVFQTRQGQPRGVRWARRVFRRLVRRAGLTRRLTPHMLRHTFATRFVESGGNVRALQRLMGHRVLKSTLIYADYVEDQALRREFEAHGRGNGNAGGQDGEGVIGATEDSLGGRQESAGRW